MRQRHSCRPYKAGGRLSSALPTRPQILACLPTVTFLLFAESLNVCLGISSIIKDTADSRIPGLSQREYVPTLGLNSLQVPVFQKNYDNHSPIRCGNDRI